MQTVQFQCGHCGKLMGVGSDHLGQQVRCPHCQQIVVAPSADPVPATTEPFLPHAAGDHEDIFAPNDGGDDLFGRNETPRIEIPPPPAAANPFQDHVPPSLESTMPYVPPAPTDSTSPFSPPADGEGTAVATSAQTPSWMTDAATESLPTPPADAAPALESKSPAPARTPRRTEPKAPWFLLLVFIPLVLYSVVITAFALMAYWKMQNLEEQRRNPFEMMPDEGDKPGVHKKKQVSLWDYSPKLPTLPLPDALCTSLNKPLRIGDVQITPKRVERKRLSVAVEGTPRSEPCQGDSLVLYLEAKNLSSEYAFAPLDNYFDRSWLSGARPPFTLLEVGEKYRCYGGPADWHSRVDASYPREWVVGRKNDPEILQPGEAGEFFVCTNGNDSKAVEALFGKSGRSPYRGSYLWRVRVRRGLVSFQDKIYSATAVVGVRFRDGDIANSPNETQ
jgi:DNA-directed RNA polymerase subunit RPC12/RpoP